jgi:excisionase family DNA binding protein
MPDDLLTIRQTATLLGAKPGSVQRWAQTGKLPATKHGRDWMIRRQDAERFHAPPQRHRNGPGSEPGPL